MHPFAETIKILGRGRKGSRSLTQLEAKHAMQMILDNKVTPEQLGAFLTLIRIREETPEEAAGFVQALRASIVLPENFPTVDIDVGAYAGKRRHLPWFILALLELAEEGYTIFLHGMQGEDERMYAEQAINALDLPIASNFSAAAANLQKYNFVYMSLEYISPKLLELIQLRKLLGLRTPMHSVARMLNPVKAKLSIHGIFHPNYAKIHQQTAALLKDTMLVFKGESGEPEINPDIDTTVFYQHKEDTEIFTWPAYFTGPPHLKEASLDMKKFHNYYHQQRQDEYAKAAITSTKYLIKNNKVIM